ncbi:MAG: bacterial Ig-like domain-containing protein [Firmicutes bacterium]|nr:bacterial Ig-like domain-containing protein [Bacillota bacterium]
MTKQKRAGKIAAFCFAFALSVALCVSAFSIFGGAKDVAQVSAAGEVWTLDNPYAGVNWNSFGQYRANLHTHTTLSDGGYGGAGDRTGTPEKMATLYSEWQYGKYQYVAITDHHGYAGAVPVTDPWTKNPAFSTPGTVGLIGNEISAIQKDGPGGDSDIQSLFTDFSKAGTGYGVDALLAEATVYKDGIGRFVFNHPGRTTNNSSPTILNSATGIGSYTYFHNLFKKYPTLLGLEVVNQADRHPNDRGFWDEVLSQRPADMTRNVFGFANDDTHGYVDNNSYPYNAPGMGYSWNTFLVLQAAFEAGGTQARDGLKKSMDDGAFFFSSYSTVGKFANTVPKGSNWQNVVNQKHSNAAANRSGAVPLVTSLIADGVTGLITLTAENADKVEWISAGGAVVETDLLAGKGGAATLSLAKTGVDKYVRAVLTIDEAGDSPCQTFTQAILINGVDAAGAAARAEINAAINSVVEKIAELPFPVTASDEAKVTEAGTAFDALTADQQMLVANLAKLVAAEAALDRLEPEPDPDPGDGELTVTGIAVTPPTKKTYKVGDTALDLTGFSVTATMSDGSKMVLTADDYTMSSFSSSTAGDKVITILYEGKTDSFTVTVEAEKKSRTSTCGGCGTVSFYDGGGFFLLLGGLGILTATVQFFRRRKIKDNA